jgi:hypothetical protein
MNMRNPCRTCEIFSRGAGYDDNHCMACAKRRAYVAAMGPMVSGLPIEMTDLGGGLDSGAGRSPRQQLLYMLSVEKIER